MLKRIIIVLISLLWIANSCQSPTELDTDRNKILPNPIDSLQLNFSSMSIETNGEYEGFIISKAMLEIDTNSTNPLIWGSLEIILDDNLNFSDEKIKLTALKLQLVNTIIKSEPQIFESSDCQESHVKYNLNCGISDEYNKLVCSDPSLNIAEISFNFNRLDHKLWIYLDSKIHTIRYFTKQESSSEIDSLPDILLIKGRFQLNY